MSFTVACHRSGQTGFMEQFLTCDEHGVVAQYDDPVALDAVNAAAGRHTADAHPAKAAPEPKAEPEPAKPKIAPRRA